MTRVERVLARLGIEAKRSGREWVALCPNPGHNDRSPSWRIRDEEGNPKDGYFHCWSCDFKGGLIALVVAVLGLTSQDARAWLAGDSDAPDKPVASSVEFKITNRRREMRLPDGVVVAPLEEWVTPARRYIEDRKIPAWQVERWGLGYAADGKLGGRIVVPYRDGGGRVRGYTARTFVGDAKRYREPDPHEGADPRAIFGEQHWTVSRETVHVAEGAFNALAVERALELLGRVSSVAALAGSGRTALRSVKLSTFRCVVVFTDSDDAGDRAAEELAGALARHSEVSRVRLPPGPDAADLSTEELAKWLAQGGRT